MAHVGVPDMMAPLDMSSKHAACVFLEVLHRVVMTTLFWTVAEIAFETG